MAGANSKLLLNEQPLLIMPQLAKLIGLNESIILQQVHYWLEINKKADKNYFDGHYWTYNTYDDWQDQFEFWSLSTITRAIHNLEQAKLLLTGNYNKLKMDRTKWYTIDYNVLAALERQPFSQNDKMHLVKMTRPIPETITETKKHYKYKRKNKRPELTSADMDVLMQIGAFK
jgi:hypothetical protein